MFVQVIRGRVRDAEGLRREWHRWGKELEPQAKGFLGSTGGISDKGEFVLIARFESEDAARRNSDRPEQGEWWKAFSATLEGEASFFESSDTQMLLGGGSDDAGFVQVMAGRVRDPARAKALSSEMEGDIRRLRPDVLGSTVAWQDEGGFVETVYFRSEAEARLGEKMELSAEDRKRFEEYDSLYENVEYIDVREPWLESP